MANENSVKKANTSKSKYRKKYTSKNNNKSKTNNKNVKNNTKVKTSNKNIKNNTKVKTSNKNTKNNTKPSDVIIKTDETVTKKNVDNIDTVLTDNTVEENTPTVSKDDNTSKGYVENKNNIMFLVVLVIILIITILLLPKIYDFIEKVNVPKVEVVDEQEEDDEKIIDDEMMESIHFPLMRNSIYNVNTYYNLDKFTISNMSNSDIILSAFLNIDEVFIEPFESVGSCTNISASFNVSFIDLRIKNILGKNVKYTLENFYVPDDGSSSYPGEWYYDSANNRFIYNGVCSSQNSTTSYYDLKQLIDIKYEGNDIVANYYIGFAVVNQNNYVIYSDPSLKTEISSGQFINKEDLEMKFEKIDNKRKNVYRYTFKDDRCSYKDYCLYSGEWVNE